MHYSLVIIGSGSANAIVPEDGADGPVALVESGVFGGTCLNRGCIPSKSFIYTADVACTIADAGRFDLDAELTGVDWPAIRDRVFAKIDHVSADGRKGRIEADHVTLIEGTARFTGPLALAVDGEEITADQIVVATGSRPTVPPIITDAGVPYETTDTIMHLDALPASMIILGGGYIAAEMAHLFSALGVRVHVIEMADRLLSALDPAIADRFTEIASERWDVHLSAKATGVVRRGDGVAVTIEGRPDVEADLLLVAVGRRPNTDDMGLDRAGIDLHDDGRIVVDEHGRTTAPGVWSLGDASSPFQLKHVANAEARTIDHNLHHPGDLRPLPHEWVPSAVFTHPQIASVGARRQDLDGVTFVEACSPFGDTAYGWALQDETSFCLLYADPGTGRLLGAHIIGPQASLLITPLIQAMSLDLRIADLARGQYWIHPALSEVVEQTLLALPLDHDVSSGLQVH